MILMAGILRLGWPIGLAFVPAGTVGLLLVMGLELGLITSCGIFNPVIATYRLQQAAPDRVARTLAAWSISTSLSIAITTALWGPSQRAHRHSRAIAAAGVLALRTPFLLPRVRRPSTAQPQNRGPIGAEA